MRPEKKVIERAGGKVAGVERNKSKLKKKRWRRAKRNTSVRLAVGTKCADVGNWCWYCFIYYMHTNIHTYI